MTLALDFTSAGLKKSVVHFIKGILLYSVIGAVGYATTQLTGWHPATLYEMLIAVGSGEFLQAVSKWVTTQQATLSAPDGTIDNTVTA